MSHRRERKFLRGQSSLVRSQFMPKAESEVGIKMKSFSVEFKKYSKGSMARGHRRGRSVESEYVIATVIAINPVEACRLAEDYRRKHLPKFELIEITADNNLVIE